MPLVPRRDFLLAAAASVAAGATRRGQAATEEFDFIVVGAGSSGCVLANRLSANPQHRVLVIEAGGPEVNPAIGIPGRWTSLVGTDLDWNYATEPEPGLGGRALRWPRGKSHGGSSSINAMAYVRGHRLCFDAWAAAAGSAWSYASLLPVFRRVEDNSRGPSDYYGAGGPLAVSDTTDAHAGHAAFLEAARLHGFSASPTYDFDGARQELGAGFYQKNIRHGRRHSAAAAFLVPALTRPNLTVWSHARARRVTLQGSRATGVEVERGGAVVRAIARREVVLSAGAIESPKLLMLSGIGPAGALRRLGIGVARDLPGVGANLQDHLRVSQRWQGRTTLPPSTVSAGLFFNSEAAAARRGTVPPDLQFYIGRGLDTPDPLVTLTVAMTQPASRGRISLRSADPADPPRIEPRYFTEPGDLQATVEGVKLARSFARSRAYEALRGAPADPDRDLRTDAEIVEFIRRAADTIFHPAGTCRMGRGPDAVVDPQLRVHGLLGLRVADASIFPVNLNSQIHAACVVIGDVAADLMGA